MLHYEKNTNNKSCLFAFNKFEINCHKFENLKLNKPIFSFLIPLKDSQPEYLCNLIFLLELGIRLD
jgi:hypothetical protein